MNTENPENPTAKPVKAAPDIPPSFAPCTAPEENSKVAKNRSASGGKTVEAIVQATRKNTMNPVTARHDEAASVTDLQRVGIALDMGWIAVIQAEERASSFRNRRTIPLTSVNITSVMYKTIPNDFEPHSAPTVPMRNAGLVWLERAHNLAASFFVIRPFSQREAHPAALVGAPQRSPLRKTGAVQDGSLNVDMGMSRYSGSARSSARMNDDSTM